MAIVTKDDFVGELKVPKTNFSELDTFIKDYEEENLINLLGAELYQLFKADLTNTDPQIPQTDRFIKLFNPFMIDSGDLIVVSKGIKKMLAQFIYFEFIRFMSFENGSSGTVINAPELGKNAVGGGNLVIEYNKGVNNAYTIQGEKLPKS